MLTAAPTLTSSGWVFQMGGWANTGGGKVRSLVVWPSRRPAADTASHRNLPASSAPTSSMTRDWLLLQHLA